MTGQDYETEHIIEQLRQMRRLLHWFGESCCGAAGERVFLTRRERLTY